MRIGVDLMGGETPPELLFPAIIRAVEELSSDLSLLVLATPDLVSSFSNVPQLQSPSFSHRISFQSCDQIITMEDAPLSVVRSKKKASLFVGIHLLNEGKIDALVSCGNTGALIASAALTLPLFPGVIQPALLATLPTKHGVLAIIDVGGSISDQAEHQVRCAFLGASYQQAMYALDKPRVGLLNIGLESGKGHAEVRKAYEQLKRLGETSTQWQFVGNVEGRDVFSGEIDVLVTDGFSGNVLLKTAEGVASLILDALPREVKDESRLQVQLKKQFNYAEYPGALVCGVEGVVIKVHGNATAESFFMSLARAYECLDRQVILEMKDALTGRGVT